MAAKKSKKKTKGILKILEAVVLIGAVAGILIKFFKGEKKTSKIKGK